jgi:hypothetical protein
VSPSPEDGDVDEDEDEDDFDQECMRCGRIPESEELTESGYCIVCWDYLLEVGPDNFDTETDTESDLSMSTETQTQTETESEPDPDRESEPDVCGATMGNGEECTYAAKHADGRCGIHTDEGEDVETDGGTNRGRPSKFNDERSTAAIEAAKIGKSKAGCARSAGVDEHTLERWLDKHADFRSDFRRARALGEDKLLQDGMYDPEADSQMARFLLSSSFGYKKASKQEVEHSGGIDGFEFTINAGSSDDDEDADDSA